MKRKEPVIRQDELDAALEEARKDFFIQPDERIPGELTVDEWAEKLGIGITTMRTKMSKAVAAGKYERLPCRAMDARGKIYTMQVYRKKKQA